MDLAMDHDKLTDTNPLNEDVLVELANVFCWRGLLNSVFVCIRIPSSIRLAYLR
jgi:hypothetical protein